MSCLTLSLMAGREAQAASRTIRLGAYVPVFCKLKRVAPYSTVHHGRGGGHGKFKIVCNTPYHMHMEGTRVPARWPHIPFFPDKHADNGLDVALRVVGNGGGLDTRCALTQDRDGGCRAINADAGASPPRLGQAEVTIEPTRHASASGLDGSDQTQTSDADGGADRTPPPWHWQRRMGLGAPVRVASAGDVAYVPHYVHDAMQDATNDTAHAATRDGAARGDTSAGDFLDRAGRTIGGRADEHITVYLTLTGRY